jgi:malonyl-CoA decarboxylase
MLASIAERGLPWAKVPASESAFDNARTLARNLIGEPGEAAGTALADSLVKLYGTLTLEDKARFLDMLAVEFAPPEEKVRAAAAAYAADPSTEKLLALSRLVEAPRQELLRRMNMAPNGMASLVRMRETLLDLVKKQPHLKPAEVDLKHLLSSWFNRGFLQIERIDWRTPALILEKLIAYEAVHEIKGWDDLRRRLAPDRRCFAFFHPALPDEPLIFVEVALTKGIVGAVQPLLAGQNDDDGAAADCDTAIFYSISNCQPGLRGISFGNFLIKQVVSELQAELPTLSCFSTLSPIPGFRASLDRKIAGGAQGLLTAEERVAIAAVAERAGQGAKGVFRALLAKPDWPEDEACREVLEGPLLRLCAEYLLTLVPGKGLADPVARFHLGNGARIERINFLGDTSPKGMRESYGLMVNYRYELGEIIANHEEFVRNGKIARSAAIDRLLAQGGNLSERARQLPGTWQARARPKKRLGTRATKPPHDLDAGL